MSKASRRRAYKRKRQRRRTRASVNDKNLAIEQFWGINIVSWVLSLYRVLRILLAGLFSLMMTLVTGLMFYLIDERFLISIDGDITTEMIIPVVVAMIVGFIMYLVGWWLIVGFRGEQVTVRKGVLWYLGIGILTLIGTLIWGVWIVIEL